MKKLFVSKNFMSKIALILVCLILFQVVAPKPVRAEGEGIGGTLLRPIVSLALFLSDGVISILQNSLFDSEDGSTDPFTYVDLSGDATSTWWKNIWVWVGIIAAGVAAFFFPGVAVAVIAVIIGGNVLVNFYPQIGAILNEVVFGDSFTFANILVTPEALLKNQIGLFDANFFRDASTLSTDATSSLATNLRGLISDVYSIIRNISIIAMMIVIVYIAIRMLLALSPREKSRYKEGFVNCVVGLIIILGMHYMMSIANTVIDNITNSIVLGDMGYLTTIDQYATDEDKEAEAKTLAETLVEDSTIVNKYVGGGTFTIAGDDIYNAFVEENKVKEAYASKISIANSTEKKISIAASNFLEIARYNGQQIFQSDEEGDNKTANWNYIGWAFVYLLLTVLTLAFVWMYGKRLLYLAGLTMFAPIVGVMYPINRVDGSRAHTLNLWFKEYFGNLIIQPFHMLLYSILIGSAMAMAIHSPLYVIIALMGLVFVEKLMKDLLGIQDTRIGGLGKSLQETNRAIKETARTTKEAAKAAKRGADRAVRAGVGFAQKVGGRRAGDTDETEEAANTTVREANNATNTTQSETRPDGTDALEAPQEEKTPQQKMLDVYDEGFGTSEWDAQERDVLARDAYAEENAKQTRERYANMSDEELAQELRDWGYTEEEIPQTIADMRKTWNAEEEQKEMLDSSNSGFEADSMNPQERETHVNNNTGKEYIDDEEYAQILRNFGAGEDEIAERIKERNAVQNTAEMQEEQKEMLDSNNSGFEADGRTPQLINEEELLDDADGGIPQVTQTGTDNNADEFLGESEIDTPDRLPEYSDVNIPGSATRGLDETEQMLTNNTVQRGPNNGSWMDEDIRAVMESKGEGEIEYRKTKSGVDVAISEGKDGPIVTADFKRASGTPKPAGTMAMKEAANSGISMDVGENPSVRTMAGRSIQEESASLNTSSVSTISAPKTGGATAHSVSAGSVSAPDYGTSTKRPAGEIIDLRERIATEKQLTDQARQNENTARAQAEQIQRSMDQIPSGTSSTQDVTIETPQSGRTTQNVQLGGNNTSTTSTRQPTQPSAQNNSNIDADVMQQLAQLEQELAAARRERETAEGKAAEAIKDVNTKAEELNKKEVASAVASTVGNIAGTAVKVGGRILEGTILGAADAMAGNPGAAVQDVVGAVKGSMADVTADRGSSATRQGRAQISNDAQYLINTEGHSQARAQYVETLCARLKEKGIVIDDRRDKAAVAEVFKDIGDKKDKDINSLIGEAKRSKINGKSKEDYERIIDSKGVSSSAKDALLKLFDSLKG